MMAFQRDKKVILVCLAFSNSICILFVVCTSSVLIYNAEMQEKNTTLLYFTLLCLTAVEKQTC